MSNKILKDPRHFQILSLGSLVALVFFWSDFAPNPLVFAATVIAGVVTQIVCIKILQYVRPPSLILPPAGGRKAEGRWGVTIGDIRSPLISSLSLTLLLKSNIIWVLPLAAAVAIASKFVVRAQGKHIFNPANFAIVLGLIFLPHHVWVSPGQWGSAIWLGFALLCLGTLVLSRARRGDIALFFLGAWAALLFGRALWLGDPFAIPLLQMQSGALLIFAFFMISDPKTTPDHWAGRLVFACVTAVIAYILQYGFQVREGIFYALFLACLSTPLWDKMWKFEQYRWRTT